VFYLWNLGRVAAASAKANGEPNQQNKYDPLIETGAFILSSVSAKLSHDLKKKNCQT
jgi:hypothetical protein